MNFSFSGCGFLGVYHLGVVSCLKTRAPHLLPHIQSVGGASAGALAAVFLLSPRADVDAALERVLETSERLRSHYLGPFDPRFDILGELELSLRRLLPDDVHISTSGKLRVSLTVVKGRRRLENLIVRDFESRDDLIEALKASCFIPLFSGIRLPRFRGQYCIDGGFTDNLPSISDAITVSPFTGETDICPLDMYSATNMNVNLKNMSFQVTLENLYRLSKALVPSEIKYFRRLRQKGYEDCFRYLSRKHIQRTLNNPHPIVNNLNQDESQNQYNIQPDGSSRTTCGIPSVCNNRYTVSASCAISVQCEATLVTTAKSQCEDVSETRLLKCDWRRRLQAGSMTLQSVGNALAMILDMVKSGLVYIKDGACYVVGVCGQATKIISLRALRSWDELYKLVTTILANTEFMPLPLPSSVLPHEASSPMSKVPAHKGKGRKRRKAKPSK